MVVLQKAPDYELDREFDFYVRATDAGLVPLYGRARVLVTIRDLNDNAPIFTRAFYSTEMAYNEKQGTVVVAVVATDPDSGVNSHLVYTFKETYNVFALDTETGILEGN